MYNKAGHSDTHLNEVEHLWGWGAKEARVQRRTQAVLTKLGMVQTNSSQILHCSVI